MTNQVRGETSITVPKVGRITLCLTMASMAAIEDHFEVKTMAEATAKLGNSPSSRDIAAMIHALMLGTPEAEKYDIEAIRRWTITPATINEAMSAMNAHNDGAAGNAASSGNRAARRAKAAQKA